MILVHRLKGEPLLLNADLIESIEETPDTVITLVDGRRILVADTGAEIIGRVLDFRAAVLAAADEFKTSDGGRVVSFPGPESPA